MAAPSPAALRRFVRDTLGCSCPEAVLKDIRCERTCGPWGRFARLDVGGRLLVWLVAPGSSPVAEVVAGCFAAGVEERDTQRFNRLRVVLATADPAVAQAAREAFAAFVAPDDRVHLHLVPETALPFAPR